MKYFISEFLGTLILSGSLNFMCDYSNGGQKLNLFEILCAMLIAVQFSRKISGGHVNPAVTLTCYLHSNEKGKKKYEEIYQEMVGGQFCAGLVAPILSSILIGNSLNIKISEDASYLGAFIVETIGAAIFYLVILTQASPGHNLTQGDEFISSMVVAIGLTTGISLAGNESGAGLNPAISISQNIVTLFVKKDIRALKYTIIYILGPVAASFLAVFLYENLNEEKFVLKEKALGNESKSSFTDNKISTKDKEIGGIYNNSIELKDKEEGLI